MQPTPITTILKQLDSESRHCASISKDACQGVTHPSLTSAAAIELAGQFPGGRDEVLAKFNPGLQVSYCRDEVRAMFGNAPSIAKLRDAYGRDVAEAWLEIQLADLSEFAGCREKLTLQRRMELAAMILQDYPHYRLTEFMLFFQRFKRCRYGKFYGVVDPMVINQALMEFDRERSAVIQKRRIRQEQTRLRAEEQLDRELRCRYRERIPGAFTDDAVIDFNQYRYMNFDILTDGELTRELARIRNGELVIPEYGPRLIEMAYRADRG